MAVGTSAAIIGGGALLGAVAGGQKSNQSQSSRSTVELGPETDLQKYLGGSGAGGIQGDYKQLQEMTNAGPGQSDVTAGLGAQRSLADMLKQYSQTGGLPSQGDTDASNAYAKQAFQGQQFGLEQSFKDQQVQGDRRAAMLGRNINDPVLAAKMMQEQTRQQGQLNANQGAFAANFAQQLPQQRLSYANQYAGIQSGLASQAMQNRQALLSMGSNLQNQDRNFQMGQATRTNETGQSSGGGLMGAISGGLASAGSFASLAGAFGGVKPGAAPAAYQDSNSGLNTGRVVRTM